MGWGECPHCNMGRVPGTKDEAHLYRARVDVFGALVLTTREINTTGRCPSRTRGTSTTSTAPGRSTKGG